MMRETTISTLSSPVEFVELDGVNIEDVPLNLGQFTIIEDGRLYYDLASKTKRVKLGGIKVDFYDERAGVTSEVDVETGRITFGGIFDWDGDGVATTGDYETAISGDRYNEGDIFTQTHVVAGTSAEDQRSVSKSIMKTRTGHMTTISDFSALAQETYFEEDIKITEDVGKYAPSEVTAGYVQLNTKGKSVTEVFKDMFQVAKQPSISEGTIRFNWTLKVIDKRLNSTITVADAGSIVSANSHSIATSMGNYQVEKGCVLSMSDSRVGFSYYLVPSYSYGPEIQPRSHLAGSSFGFGFSTNTSEGSYQTIYSINDTDNRLRLDSFAAPDRSINSDYYIRLYYSRRWSSRLPYANNNLGDRANPTVRLSSADCARCIKLAPYRQGSFYGYKTSGFVPTASIVSGNDCTSAIRGTGMTAQGSAFSASNRTVTVPIGTTCVIFAVPDGKEVYQIKNTTVGFDHVEGDFVKVTGVKVQDASGSTTDNYTVYYYAPATGAYENATTFVFYYK